MNLNKRSAQKQLAESRDDDINSKHGEVSQAVAQQRRTEEFGERFEKPLSEGVFRNASMPPAT